jgi:hypothetical protein
MLVYSDFRWKGDKLLAGSKNTGAKIITDSQWPGMFRVEYPPGTVSDMARDAAISIVAHHLNREARKTRVEASQNNYSDPVGVSYPPPSIGLTGASISAALG